ncbi:hypothetical protein QYE76_062400 [Lolium multiflorum]|uniref:CCHC-type domain-containing protein n=1 Tax=Lolium multiflorum TaxID=4521 RepID=A0AAD8S570_LOLMU|nr:hypothetical protein QYE76_062400 [Lolium multiflorum]
MVNKTTGFKKQGKSKGKFKKGGKKAATPPMKPKNGPKPDAECYYCKEKGHWKRNCSKYLADLRAALSRRRKKYVGNDDRCFLAMVMWWTCPQYLKKHEEGKKKRAEMRGGSHILGSIPLSLHMQAEPNVFAVLKKMKQRKTPHPETGSTWVNEQAETQCTEYVSKYKEKHSETSQPEAEDFNVEMQTSPQMMPNMQQQMMPNMPLIQAPSTQSPVTPLTVNNTNIIRNLIPERMSRRCDVSSPDERVCEEVHQGSPLAVVLMQASGHEIPELQCRCAVRNCRQLSETEGTFGDASKKGHGVEDVVVTRSSQGLAQLSPMSHPEPEAGHHHETADWETELAPPATLQPVLPAQGTQ